MWHSSSPGLPYSAAGGSWYSSLKEAFNHINTPPQISVVHLREYSNLFNTIFTKQILFIK